jgi:cobalt-zinc-cadmium efflux system outer membrane protein
MKPLPIVCFVVCAFVSRVATAQERDEDRLAQAVDRDLLVRIAIDRSPSLKAGAQRVAGMRSSAQSDGSLPPPEVSFDIWQVPFVRPVAFGDSQMISVGLHQRFPAVGSLSAREEGMTKLADVEDAMLKDRVRMLSSDVAHTLVDLQEATAMEDNHLAHKALSDQIEQAAIARQAGGGPLSDVTMARVETAAFETNAVSQAALGFKARARLNALLSRPLDAPVARADLPTPTTTAAPLDALVALAQQSRPELRAATVRDEAQQSFARSARREATIPEFSVGVAYFAPTTLMPEHGYGLSASMSMPWLWGAASHKSDAQQALEHAAAFDVEDARLRLSVEIATAFGSVKAMGARLSALQERALPAARQALDGSLSSYRSGQGDLLTLLRAERSVVDTEQEIIMARAALEHALVDLDAAVGAAVPRTNIPSPASGGTP